MYVSKMNRIILLGIIFLSGGFIQIYSQFNTDLSLDNWINIGSYFYNKRKPDSAEFAFKNALYLDSTFQLANYWMGVVEYNLKRNELNAEAYFLKAARSKNELADVFNYLGIIYSNRLEYKRAEIYFKKALKARPGDELAQISLIGIYLKTDQSNDADDLKKQILKKDSISNRMLMNLGIVYGINKYYNEAERIFKLVISNDSANTLALYKLGGIYNEMDRLFAAEPLFKKAFSLDSNLRLSYYGYYLETKTWYKNANSLDSNFTIPFSKLGWLYFLTKKIKEAERSYEIAISMDSSNGIAYSKLGWIYAMTDRYKEAEYMLRKAISMDSNNLDPVISLAFCEMQTNRLKEAEQDLLNALKSNSRCVPALFGMTYIECGRNNLDVAFEYLERALVSKNSTRQLFRVGDFYSLKGICLLHSLQGLTEEMLNNDEQLPKVRKLSKWHELVVRYFPKKI